MAGTISYFMYSAGVKALVAEQLRSLEAATQRAAVVFGGRIGFALNQTRLVYETPETGRAVQDVGNPSSFVVAASRERVAEMLTALIRIWPDFYQARLIGLADGGKELVRVERTRDGAVVRTPPAELQQKGDRDYYQAISALQPGEPYLSALDLNRENGEIEVPFRPTVRAGMLIGDRSGRPRAMIVINADLTRNFDAVRAAIGPSNIAFIANEAGDYLLAPDGAKAFAFEQGGRQRLPDDVPELAAWFASDADTFSGPVTMAGDGYYASAQKVHFDAANPARYAVIAALSPQAALFTAVARERDAVLLLAAVLILCGVGFAIVMARAVAAPIGRMTAVAGEIAAGRRDVDLSLEKERRDETGDLARAIGAMAEDIRLREDRLVEQAAELSRSNRELGQFAYVASHDLQEPLRMVGSYLDLLKRRYDDKLDDDAREFIGYAVDGAQRMKRLINDLLSYSRAGNNPLKVEMVDSGVVVANVVRLLQPQIEETGARVTFDNLPRLAADAGQLERLFVNLIENALKYRSADPPRVHVAAARDGRAWRFSVADNGIGIDPRFRDKVFEIFKRLHSRNEKSGTGIGLAVCKLVVERHGGTIAVTANPGGGSVFTFTLPDRRTSDVG
jgi:signal transduction histidine kinase